MSAVLTIRLDDDLQSLLDRACHIAGCTRSDLAREALRRQLTIASFDELRRQVMPPAAEKGILTDEDLFSRGFVKIVLDTNVLISASAARGLLRANAPRNPNP
ncbi:MAG: hypothetical protein ACFCU3_01510 [Verrucomicrobiales bacterium]